MTDLPLDNLPGYRITETGIVIGPRGPMTPDTMKRGKHKRVKIRGKHYFVHHLVLQAFGPPRPDGFITRHLDGDASNNHISNLAWGTPRENYDDVIKHGSSKKPPSPIDIFAVKFLRNFGLYQQDITDVLGISQPTVSRYLINYA